MGWIRISGAGCCGGCGQFARAKAAYWVESIGGMASDGQQVYAAISDVVRKRRAAGPDDVRAFELDPLQWGLTALRVEDGQKSWDVAGSPRQPAKPGCSLAQSRAVTAIAGGMVFVNSGYARFGAMPGNVLLAFAPET